MIAYHILCHGDFAQVAKLVEALYSKEDTFLIDVDDGQSPNIRPIKHLVKRNNVHLKYDSNIAWGGSGTLRKTLSGALELLKLANSWEYYVVLSGQDLPLKSNDVIKNRLAEGSTEKISFIRAFSADLLDRKSLPVSNTTSSCQLWGDRGHTRVYAKPGVINPQINMGARWFVDVAEVGEKGEVYVGNIDHLLFTMRSAFFKRYPFHTGANWFNLHRSLLEHMRDDSFTYELYDVMRGTFIPDESFFQTYVKNSVFRDLTNMRYDRLILRPGPVPRVKVFDDSDWPVIEQASELFGRKFDMVKHARIVHRVLASRSSSARKQEDAA